MSCPHCRDAASLRKAVYDAVAAVWDGEKPRPGCVLPANSPLI